MIKTTSPENFEEGKTRVSARYRNLFSDGPECPLRIQVAPSRDIETDPLLPKEIVQWCLENLNSPFPWRKDAIGDQEFSTSPRLSHRYRNRLLFHVTNACFVYCRFCFRKDHLNAIEDPLYRGPIDPVCDYLLKHPEIEEVILTGGDPMILSHEKLERIFSELEKIPTVKTVRIHSRVLSVDPSKVTEKHIELLAKFSEIKNVALASHFNHPKEWSPESKKSAQKLKRAGVSLLNQTVLLNGVNNSSDVLAELFQTLYDNGIQNFHLHHPDWAEKTFGFRVSIPDGLRIYRRVQSKVSGPALPKYVLDSPDLPGKILLTDQLQIHEEGRKIFETPLRKISAGFYKIGEHVNKKIPYLDLSWIP